MEFAKFRARRTRMNLFGVTITQRRYKIRLVAWLVGEESRIDGCLVESGHRAHAQTERASRKNEISALSRTVAEGGFSPNRIVLCEPTPGFRPEERRFGKDCVSECRTRGL